MIVSVTLGWASVAASSTSKPLLTIGLATCLFVFFTTLRASMAAATQSWRRRVSALRQIDVLAREVDQTRSRHFTKRSDKQGWNGLRKFYVSRKERECDGCHSFYLRPCDGKQLPEFHPGQYLLFSLMIPGDEKPIVRCYSLSDAPGKPYYRCTIKQVPPAGKALPPGKSSTFFNEHVGVDDIVDVQAPRGRFYLNMEHPNPVVLLAGGVGITPLLSMLNTVLEREQARETHLFFGVRNSQDHLFREHVQPLRGQGHRYVHAHICYSRPLPNDVLGRDYDFEGRVTVELLSRVLPAKAYDYFMCGPVPFMDALEKGLEQWGVPPERIHLEAFGSQKSITKPRPTAAAMADGNRPDAGPEIRFVASGRKLNWVPSYDSLLDLAEAHGIAIESGCRAGNCGTCATPVKSGTVIYQTPPDSEPDSGMCLPCVCLPDGPVELDA